MVLSLGFAECVLSSIDALCELILNAWSTFELIFRGNLYASVQSAVLKANQWLTRYMFQSSRQTSPSPHVLHGSCPGKELCESCHPWTVCFATEGSLQFHYMACAWTWRHVRKKEKKCFRNMFEKACVLLLCCFGSFSFCVGFFFLLLLHQHLNDVMKPCRDGWQMYITWIIVVKLRRLDGGAPLLCSTDEMGFFYLLNQTFSSRVVLVCLF